MPGPVCDQVEPKTAMLGHERVATDAQMDSSSAAVHKLASMSSCRDWQPSDCSILLQGFLVS